jgi:hypothetical protein
VLGLSLMWHLITAWFDDRRRLIEEQGKDRGEILQTVVIIGAFVAAAIIIVAILVAKATNAANNVQTQ